RPLGRGGRLRGDRDLCHGRRGRDHDSAVIAALGVASGYRKQAMGDYITADRAPQRLPGADVEAPVDAGVDPAVGTLLKRLREAAVRARRARQTVGVERE